MAIIKKFRIKSFKNIDTIIEFQNVSLAYGNRLILDNIIFGSATFFLRDICCHQFTVLIKVKTARQTIRHC